MRVAQRGVASSMLLPRVGWNVLTFNEEGTADAPVVLSRIHDGEHMPAYPLPAHKTRVVFKTATSPGGGSFNEIYFEDKLGAEEMFINASRDQKILVQHVKNDAVMRDQSRQVGKLHSLDVGSSYLETIKRHQSVTIGGTESIEVGTGCEKTVGENESSTIAGKRTVKTGDSHNDSVGASRRLSVGAAQIDISLGRIEATSRFNTVLVGGAMIRAAAESISEDAGKVSVQTIGGAKVEIAKEARPIDVKKAWRETVGGVMVLKTDGAFVDGADEKSAWTIGAALSGKAPKVFIEAKDRIELKCGSSSIVVLPDKVELRAKAFDLTKSSELELLTKKVEHN
jgi:type VI secretion system secreted protein VgrG